MGLGQFHAVRFYDNDAALCRVVASFLREGLVMGQPALIIATPEHVEGIISGLRTREMNINALRETDNLIVLDAQKTMDSFMVDGRPDAALFNETATAALDMTRNHGDADSRVRRDGRSALEGRPRRGGHPAGDVVEQARAVAPVLAAVRIRDGQLL
jgi:hypothetical protein